MSSSNENSTNHSDLSVPYSDIPTQKSPMPLRLLREIEEETWLSGCELKTDNSSSDDENKMSEKKTGLFFKWYLCKNLCEVLYNFKELKQRNSKLGQRKKVK